MKNFLTLITILTLSITACSKKTEQSAKPQGGQDSGGGNTTTSTKEEVRDAIDRALSNSIMIGGIFMKMRDSNNEEFKKISQKFFDKIIPLYDKNYPSQRESDKITHTLRTYLLDHKKIKIQDKGACNASNNSHAQASVAEHSLKAELCFSLELLSQVASDALENEVLLLLIHEEAHMLGFKEAEAQVIQNFAKNNISQMKVRSNYYSYIVEQIMLPLEMLVNIDNGSATELKYHLGDNSCHKLVLQLSWVMQIGSLLEFEKIDKEDFFKYLNKIPSGNVENYHESFETNLLYKANGILWQKIKLGLKEYCMIDSGKVPIDFASAVKDQAKKNYIEFSNFFSRDSYTLELIQSGKL